MLYGLNDTLLMRILDVHPNDRVAFEDTLRSTPPQYLELALLQLTQHESDPEYDPSVSAWMEEYLPILVQR